MTDTSPVMKTGGLAGGVWENAAKLKSKKASVAYARFVLAALGRARFTIMSLLGSARADHKRGARLSGGERAIHGPKGPQCEDSKTVKHLAHRSVPSLAISASIGKANSSKIRRFGG
jgi:hypothetical protein